MLMVIFGAGASYDSVAEWPPKTVFKQARPPLANELFHERYARFRMEFPQFLSVLAELVPKQGRAIEEAMERLRRDGATNPVRLQQLTAIRYYLCALLENLAQEWLSLTGGYTIYNTLLEQIQHNRKADEPVCLVTFNYDTLLEAALRAQFGMSFVVMPDYVSHPHFKLFKLHGSTTWGRMATSAPTTLGGKWEPADVIGNPQRFTWGGYATRDGYMGPPLLPAIAIPVTEKQDFECPPEHVALLRDELIPRITKILAIGWRGTEDHFLALLRYHPSPVTVVTVAGSEADADETLDKLRKTGMGIAAHVSLAGFSDTIGDRRLDGFFAL